MTLSNSKVNIIVLASATLILAALLAFAAYKIVSQNSETAELIKQANEVAASGILAQSIKALQNAAGEDISSFERLALTEHRAVELIESLESAGENLGIAVVIRSVEVSALREDPEVKGLRIAIEAEGRWSPLFSFLKAVESLPHRVVFERADMTKSAGAWSAKTTIFIPSFD